MAGTGLSSACWAASATDRTSARTRSRRPRSALARADRRRLQVVRARRLGSSLVRVTFAGEDLKYFFSDGR
ncbi:hypothetical protein ABZT00_40975, partial [Streptomyces sp. NPDC005486]